MSKKNTEDTQDFESESSLEPTKPVKVNRKVFKDQPAAKAEPAPATIVVEEVVEPLDEPKPKKVRHGKWVWLGILLLLVIGAIGSGIGYASAMKVRMVQETSEKIRLATTQFVMAEEDQRSGNLDMARQRLEYVVKIYPDYPGLEAKLTEVILAITLSQPPVPTQSVTAQAVATPVVSKDTRNLADLLSQAENLLRNAPGQSDAFTCTEIKDIYTEDSAYQPWEALLMKVNVLRNLDPTYEPIKVDGLYYYALRYNGISNINAGYLEQGLYYLSMAEQIAPLDVDAEAKRSQAVMYLAAESWFGVNWTNAADRLLTIYQQFPGLVDVSCITPKIRYVDSLEGIGDDLMMETKYCEAIAKYQTAKDILSDELLLGKLQKSQEFCANPPATPTPTVDPYAPKVTPTPSP